MLRLQIIEGPTNASQPTDSFLVGPAGATVGRTDACAWKLEDPNSLISRQHLQIVFEGGDYQLRDTSTNGSFLNKSEEAIGRGNQVPLKAGDHIQLGEYVISVEAYSASGAQAPDLALAPDLGFAPGQSAGADSLGQKTDVSAGSPPDIAAFADVVAAPLASDLLGAEAAPGRRHEAAAGQSPLLGAGPAESPLGVPVRAKYNTSGLLPPLQGGHIPAEGADGAALLNPAPQQLPQASPAQSPASAAGASNQLIPDDWFALDADDLLGDSPVSSTPVRESPQQPGRAPVAPPAPSARPVADNAASTPLSPEPGTGPLIPDFDIDLPPAAGYTSNAPPPPVGSGVDSPLPTQEAPAQPADRNTQGGESAVLDKLRHVVRDVIGDSADSASAGDLLSIVEQLAQIVAIVTPRTRAALSARSQFKDTLRLRQTLIRASENNPLKISVSDEEALRRMLTSSEPGMLGGVDAVNQALGELAAHQSALVAALKPALGATLRSLSPEAIEKKSGGAKSERLPMINRRGKLWEEYSSMYKELAESDGRALEQKFLLALAKHYETALTSFES